MKKIWSLLCALGLCLMTEQPAASVYNGAPRLQGALYETIENVPVYGNLSAFDPEGDEVEILVCQPPKKGSVAFDGTSFVYTPYPGQRGEDSFSAQAMDRYGNRSNEAVAAISIRRGSGAPYFADMDRHPYEYSAIKLAQAGVLGGEQVGEHLLFYPQRQVSRGEYVVMLLAALGKDQGLTPCVNTGLQNDGAIPLWLKPYLSRAIECGIVTEEAFDTETVPTRAEAVVLCERAAQIGDILKYNLQIGDRDTIPSWALESYVNLSAYGILDLYDGNAYPTQALDRGYACSLLWQLYKYVNK
ncbi:Ig-like domain-containing protein [Harryflintia acetispora]|uniref:S-layer family protein n=1 Tax=Harryflintia acetispora TaxID=1849041 RepID=A0A9X8UJB4_9FIRM|nr:Ig-like domain-containing protein [Harryflintia acetispora]TCL42786.1 S-layer family protein [Harryflintia acetispora]